MTLMTEVIAPAASEAHASRTSPRAGSRCRSASPAAHSVNAVSNATTPMYSPSGSAAGAPVEDEPDEQHDERRAQPRAVDHRERLGVGDHALAEQATARSPPPASRSARCTRRASRTRPGCRARCTSERRSGSASVRRRPLFSSCSANTKSEQSPHNVVRRPAIATTHNGAPAWPRNCDAHRPCSGSGRAASCDPSDRMHAASPAPASPRSARAPPPAA